jgi:gliotoxin/aspirochlorine biosynthesis glutathione S-transferase
MPNEATNEMSSTVNGVVVKGDVEYDGRVILYIIKGMYSRTCARRPGIESHLADQTSYINYIKPLILVEELQLPYVVSVIDTKDEWYYRVHPERYVPALKDQDPDTKQEITVFESTACLQYIAQRFDKNGDWSGRTAWESAQVLSWTAYQTAGLGYAVPTPRRLQTDRWQSHCKILVVFLKGLS